MPRSFSAATKQALYAQETGDVLLMLLTITGTGLAQPLRFVNDLKDITSRGNLYTAFPFTMTLPDEREDQVPHVRLSIDNVDRQIVQAVRSLTVPPLLTLEIIRAAAPDTVEAGPFDFTLRNVDYDALAVSGDLAFEDVLNEQFPEGSFTPGLFPALF